jgi:hypothetical protein
MTLGTRNRSFRTGRLAKEPQWPSRITRAYAYRLLHNARMVLYVQCRNDWDADIRAIAGNCLGALERDFLARTAPSQAQLEEDEFRQMCAEEGI